MHLPSKECETLVLVLRLFIPLFLSLLREQSTENLGFNDSGYSDTVTLFSIPIVWSLVAIS